MVPTQDSALLLAHPLLAQSVARSAVQAFDLLPAAVVAVVLVAFAVALVTVSVRRRDAD